MNPFRWPFSLIAFMGFVAVVPIWMWWLDNYSAPLSVEGRFVAQLVLPAAVALFLVSWLQPRSG